MKEDMAMLETRITSVVIEGVIETHLHVCHGSYHTGESLNLRNGCSDHESDHPEENDCDGPAVAAFGGEEGWSFEESFYDVDIEDLETWIGVRTCTTLTGEMKGVQVDREGKELNRSMLDREVVLHIPIFPYKPPAMICDTKASALQAVCQS